MESKSTRQPNRKITTEMKTYDGTGLDEHESGDWVRLEDARILLTALKEIAEETKRQQLPITCAVHEIATKAIAKVAA